LLARVVEYFYFAAFAMSALLLITTALEEVGTGVALLIAPSRIVELLAGEGLSSPQSLVLGQVTGAALISMGVACWLTSQGEPSGHRGLVGGMLIYNVEQETNRGSRRAEPLTHCLHYLCVFLFR
jgi:hypothetical protein